MKGSEELQENQYFIKRENCPVCKSVDKKTLFSCDFSDPPISNYLEDFYLPQGAVDFNYLSGTKYILDECNACGLIYQRLIPNDYLMEKLYEEWIDPKKVLINKVMNRDIRYYTNIAREIEMIIHYFNVIPSKLNFLDFGMGWGKWCLMAKAYGCNVIGTELSKARINYANSTGVKTIPWENIQDHLFDFINTEAVLEHIANPIKTLQYLSKSLKPLGIIKISVPNGWDIHRRLAVMNWTPDKSSQDSLNAVAPLEHINCFTESSLRRL
jgi:2-polyprenyl-3-methyl-5-hydroxy-6-metoxy-1,4-benzoquinol methylase